MGEIIRPLRPQLRDVIVLYSAAASLRTLPLGLCAFWAEERLEAIHRARRAHRDDHVAGLEHRLPEG